MGYFSIGKKIIIAGSFVLLSALCGIATAQDFDVSPREQVFFTVCQKDV